MSLNEIEKAKLTKQFRRFNRKIWKDELILKVIENVEAIQEGRINRKDYFIPGIITYEDYLWQLNLIKFV